MNEKGLNIREKVKDIITTAALSFVLLIICGVLFIAASFICAICPFWGLNGLGNHTTAMIKLFLVISFLFFNLIAVIIFKRRLNKIWKYPLLLTISSIVIFLCGIGAVSCGYLYHSRFTPQKWQNNPECRYLMIDNIEKKYKITGMTKQEITDLLGSPTHSSQRGQYELYEYYISIGYIDPITYDIYFDNNVVIKTAKTEH